MALTKTTINDKIEVLQLAAGYSVVQVRTATIIAEDDVEIMKTLKNIQVFKPNEVTNDIVTDFLYNDAPSYINLVR